MKTLVDAYLDHRFKWRPVDATFMGATGHDDRLPPIDAVCISAERAEIASLKQLSEQDTAAHPHDRALISAELEMENERLENRPRQANPAWLTGEAAFGIIVLLLPQSEPWRREAFSARLAAIPAFLEAGRALIGDRPTPAGWVARAQVEAKAMASFLRNDIKLHPAWSEEWAADADAAAGAFDTFQASILSLPDADPACGAAHLARVFSICHGLTITPDEAVARAEEAFDRCSAQLVDTGHAIDPTTPWQEQVAALSKIGPDQAADLVASYRHWDEAASAAAAEHGLVTPEYSYGLDYRALPPWFTTLAEKLYFLFYRSPPGLDPQAGSVYWVMPVKGGDFSPHSTAMIKAIHAVHHGSVGHHTQNARARASASRLGRIAATDCAMGLAFPAALTLVEGWACHVEDVLIEAPGFYTPTEVLLLKSFERRNAASVMVDVNLHMGRWSMVDAHRFYAEKAGYAPSRVASEVVRNTMFPGSRATYWLGVEGIRELRKRWTGNIQEFHDTLLSFGHVPLAWVEVAMAESGKIKP